MKQILRCNILQKKGKIMLIVNVFTKFYFQILHNMQKCQIIDPPCE